MVKQFIYILFSSFVCFSQNEQLSQYYYDKGDFEKAKMGYEVLSKSMPRNQDYFIRMITCYQQLKQFDVAEKAITTQMNQYNQNTLLVELGYNFQLQKKEAQAQKYFQQALDKIRSNPNEVYSIARAFEQKVIIDYALKAYQLAVQLQPHFDFNYQIGLLYGQLGDIENMIRTLLEEAFTHPEKTYLIQSQFSQFMIDEGNSGFSSHLKKALLVRNQKNQDLFWNRFLSWYYTQQKEFDKALIQEKAIYKRNPDSFLNIINLAQLAIEEKDEATAKAIFSFVLENATEQNLLIQAHLYLMQLEIESTPEKDSASIETKLANLLQQYGITPATLSLQLLQAHFLAFDLKKTTEAKNNIKKILDLPLNEYEVAKTKMVLADILLSEEKFNQALLYYSQIESEVKNDEIAYQASLKSAKTSYFKTDLDWALKQFKELKSASTQLIANDALEYFLLLNDNTVADSTQTALKAFAKADYLVYQNRNQEAAKAFQTILQQHKGNTIEAVTLLHLGKVYEKLGNFLLAIDQYQTIITAHSDSIYVDEALFFSAEVYKNQLQLPEKAKECYEKLIFNHQDSIYFIEARRNFRVLRGDTQL